jgi:hypothetical protein
MTDNAGEDKYFWVKFFAAVFAIVATHRWIAVHAAAWYLSFKRISTLIVTDGEFVKRPAIEEAFSAALKSTDYESVLVYGQIGSGKTSFIRSALQGCVLVIISYFQKDCR